MAINPYRKGGPDVPVLDGGTGASLATTARTNLGVDLTVASHATTDHTGITGVGTGKVVQQVRAEFRSNLAVTVSTPADNSIPQFSEGQALMQVSITPQSLSNILVIQFMSWGGIGGSPGFLVMHLHRDSAADAIAAAYKTWNGSPGSSGGIFALTHFLTAPSLSSQTYQLRVGTGGGSHTINGAPSLGAARQTTLICTEYAP
jgi:hypothetical protein